MLRMSQRDRDRLLVLRQVAAGEVFATKNGVDRRAEHDFYPVLMSTHGYADRIGFKARHPGRVEEV